MSRFGQSTTTEPQQKDLARIKQVVFDILRSSLLPQPTLRDIHKALHEKGLSASDPEILLAVRSLQQDGHNITISSVPVFVFNDTGD
jgi:hypothetical protein